MPPETSRSSCRTLRPGALQHPSGAINTANFGRITSAQDGRVIQLGIKYLFLTLTT
jgi:hypothetical protein